MTSEWFESFFTPLALDFWRAVVPSAATGDEVDFLVRNLAVSPPSRLLALPCGFGRHAIGLASRGYRVTGIDIATSAVIAAQQQGQALGLSTANFLVGDMRRPSPGGPFDGADCLGNSFTYLPHEDTIGFVRNVFAALRPGAGWIIDTSAGAGSLLPELKDESQLSARGA